MRKPLSAKNVLKVTQDPGRVEKSKWKMTTGITKKIRSPVSAGRFPRENRAATGASDPPVPACGVRRAGAATSDRRAAEDWRDHTG
jgi:hypothetical protein